MNNYYFVVLLHHILLYHSCICLPSHYLLLHPNNHNNNNNETPTNQYCQQNMKYGQIVAFLSKTRCSSIKEKTPVDINNNNNNNNRHKSDVNAGTNDIRALQTTINDHRSMIEYLINNSINATFVSEAINRYHNSTAPTLTSWRDLVDLLFIALLLLALLYFLIFRVGFSKRDKALVYIFRPVHHRLQRQKQHQRPTAPPPPKTQQPTIPSDQILPNFTISNTFRDALRNANQYQIQ